MYWSATRFVWYAERPQRQTVGEHPFEEGQVTVCGRLVHWRGAVVGLAALRHGLDRHCSAVERFEHSEGLILIQWGNGAEYS